MDRFDFLFLIFGLFCYFIGFFFSKRIYSRVSGFVVDTIQFRPRILWQKWNDRILITIYSLTTVLGVILYLYFREELEKQKFFIADLIQSEIFLATLFTLIYSILLKDKANEYRNRPIFRVKFNDKESEYYHKTLMTIQTKLLVQQQNFTNIIPLVDSVPAYYARLKIFNEGKKTLNNAEVIVEKVEVQGKTVLLRPFMPLNLHWAFAEERERIKINIPPYNAFRIIDFLELTHPTQTKAYAQKLDNKAIDYDRYNALVTGFRICTIPPNTLSDIFEKGTYVFTLGIYADNAEPALKKISVDYDGGWNDDQKVMREKHLKVKLLDS